MPSTLPASLVYAQQIKLPEVGEAGQDKLKKARVLCIGAGGLGTPLLLYLARAGVGTLGIVDDDVVEPSNLHRQILYHVDGLQTPKVEQAKAQLALHNPWVNVKTHHTRALPKNIASLLADYDLVADGSDNFYTRYLVQEACFKNDKPYFYASAHQFQGQCAVFYGQTNPCLRCVFENPPLDAPNCAEGGVLGVVPGLLGMLQATEVLKWILGIEKPLLNQLLTVDVKTMQFKTIQLTKNPDCPFCQKGQSITEVLPPPTCSQEAITPPALSTYLKSNPNALCIDVRTLEERVVSHIGGIHIPLHTLAERLADIPRDVPILVYCQSGPRSVQALQLLKKAGYKTIHYLKGGLASYRLSERGL